MKLEKIVSPAFFKALNELGELSVPVIVGYKVVDLLEKVKKERITFELLRQKLLAKHGEKDEKGNLKTNETKTEYLLTDAKAFQKEYQELLSLEVDLPKISISELGDVKLPALTLAEVRDLLIP